MTRSSSPYYVLAVKDNLLLTIIYIAFAGVIQFILNKCLPMNFTYGIGSGKQK